MNFKLLLASLALAAAGISSAQAQSYYSAAPRYEDARIRYVPAPVQNRRDEPARVVVVSPTYCSTRVVVTALPGHGRPVRALPVRRYWGWW